MHTFHQFWRHQGWSATTVFPVHIGLAFSELPSPSSDHTVTHNVGSIHVAQLTVDLCWKLLLSLQKSDNCKNLAVGRRQYQCSHFILALCNNYCRHYKIETAMHYSHIFPLYCYTCSFPSDYSYHLWTWLELTFSMNLVYRSYIQAVKKISYKAWWLVDGYHVIIFC